VLGVSGSPHPNSNTDRLVRRILASTGLDWELVKLSELTVRPCRACVECAAHNRCTQPDDFPALADKLRRAGGLVVGCYPPYGSVDAFTKAFLERLYSLRHRRGLNRGKPAVVAVVGNARGARGVAEAAEQVAHALGREEMVVMGSVTAAGNPNCLVCGFGESCRLSAVPRLFPASPVIGPDKFSAVERQPEVWRRAQKLGQELGRRLRAEVPA
jgi:multimeric flavodoxin WrbA